MGAPNRGDNAIIPAMVIASDHIDPESLPRSVLGRLIETAVDLLCVIDREGRLAWFNPAWSVMLEWSSEQLEGKSLYELLHPSDVEHVCTVLRRIREHTDPIRFESRLRTSDGSHRWLEWSGMPIGGGAVYGMARDITEQKQAEHEVNKRNRLLLMAEEVAGVGHWRIDLMGDSLTWSREMYRIHGVDPQTFTPTVEKAVEAYHPEDRGLVSDHIRDAILLRKEFELELRIVRADGVIRNVLSKGKCEISEDGSPVAVFGVFQDVTERQRLQDQVAHSERMATVGTLAAGVAHEINNPLTWVIANLDAIDRGLNGGAQAGEELELIEKMIAEAQQGAEQVKRIVSDLLTYSRSQPERMERVELHEVLDTAVNIATNQFKYRARLVRDYGRSPAVIADQSRLTQVFVNLIINAAQAIPERRNVEGMIEIRTGVDDHGHARIEIIDNGLGMPAAVVARVFDPFYTTKPVGVGTGLGLSISNNIIRSLHGEISIQSTEEQGTRVKVMLPPAPDENDSFFTIEAADAKLQILVVDKEGQLGQPIAQILSHEYEVISLRSGRDALTVIGSGGAVDAILCDVDIEDMTGMEFYKNVQKIAEHLVRRIGFIASSEELGTHRALFERNGLLFLEKPIQPSVLRELVDQLAY